MFFFRVNIFHSKLMPFKHGIFHLMIIEILINYNLKFVKFKKRISVCVLEDVGNDIKCSYRNQIFFLEEKEIQKNQTFYKNDFSNRIDGIIQFSKRKIK